MPAQPSRPLGRKALIRPAQRLPLRVENAASQAALARRPQAATRPSGTTAHARSHFTRHVQS